MERLQEKMGEKTLNTYGQSRYIKMLVQLILISLRNKSYEFKRFPFIGRLFCF